MNIPKRHKIQSTYLTKNSGTKTLTTNTYLLMDYENKYRELVNDHIQLEKQNKVLTEALQKIIWATKNIKWTYGELTEAWDNADKTLKE